MFVLRFDFFRSWEEVRQKGYLDVWSFPTPPSYVDIPNRVSTPSGVVFWGHLNTWDPSSSPVPPSRSSPFDTSVSPMFTEIPKGKRRVFLRIRFHGRLETGSRVYSSGSFLPRSRGLRLYIFFRTDRSPRLWNCRWGESPTLRDRYGVRTTPRPSKEDTRIVKSEICKLPWNNLRMLTS